MARQRPRRQSMTTRDRVGTGPSRRRRPASARHPKSPGRLRRFTGALFGITRTITVEGVRYKERSRTSLERALGPRGKGSKVYEVRFPAGRPMTINATESRRYADLMPDPALVSIERARRFIRPGQRVLILGSGTGAIADQIARWTGQHAGVIALEHDHESVRFARRRYAPPATSLERGGAELLAGEMDGAFDAVVINQSYVYACEKPTVVWDEAWRLLADEGQIIHLGGDPDHPASAPRVPEGLPVRAVTIDPPRGGLPIRVLTRITAPRGDQPNRTDENDADNPTD